MFLLVPKLSTDAQQSPTEAYRLQITNVLHGAVELSIDGGKTWLLAARVSRPATNPKPGAQSSVAEVQVSSGDGLSFGVGNAWLVSLGPESVANLKNKSSIIVNVPTSAGLFKDFMPTVGSPIRQVVSGKVLDGFQATPYVPKEGDVLQIVASRTSFPAAKLSDYAQDAARYYRERVIARVRAKGKKPSSGTLSVMAKLHKGDEPSAVTFLVDGNVAAIMNHSPFEMRFNTREWANGEHLLEIRALGPTGEIVSKSQALIVVDNSDLSP